MLVDFVGKKSTYVKDGFSKKAKGQRSMFIYIRIIIIKYVFSNVNFKDLKRLHVSGFDKTIKENDLKKLFPNCADFFMQKKRNKEFNLG